ncbi:MAG: hypothetical protein EA397_03855 [Deltaproteobacteria bacterium]|nr:MAG: hypothetical protein EA397_03855 [Deltaproteobacteria bacterium]
MIRARPITAALLVGVMGLSAGCWPRVVTDITLAPSHAKIAYFKQRIFVAETGVVECDRAEDGTLSNCKNLAISFRKP